jgi:hypothetical protein
VYPCIGDLTNLARYPPLNQISYFVITSLTTTYVEIGSSIQGRLQDGANIEEFKYLSKEKIFPIPTSFIASLPEDEHV